VKLSLDTYSICQQMTLQHLLELAPKYGISALEFRCESQQGHGVELDMDSMRRREVRQLIEQAGLECSVLSTSQRFDSTEAAVREAAVERSKRYIGLAQDLGAVGIRLFGNDFPPDVAREDVIAYVGDALREVGEFAETTATESDHGVDALLEMHGQFYYWEYALAAVERANHSHVALNYNSDPRDVANGSAAFVLGKVGPRLHHVHLHDVGDGGYPYVELFSYLCGIGYVRYLSLELTYSGGDPDNVIRLNAALYRSLLAQARLAG